MNGNNEAGVMVRTPAGGSVMANWIVFVPPGIPLADVMAARSEPAPVSLVVVTMKVSARVAGAAGSPRSSPRIKILIFRVVFILILPAKAGSFSENAIPHGQAHWSIHTDSQEGMEKSFKKDVLSQSSASCLVLVLVLVLDFPAISRT